MSGGNFVKPVDDLALELGVHLSGLCRRVRVLGIDARRRPVMHAGTRHRRLCVTPADAQRLRADYAARVRPAEDLAHWLTAEQASTALGLTRPAFYQRRASGTLQIEMRVLTGISGRHCRYSPDDVRRETRALGVRPRSTPAGAWSSREMQDTLGVTRDMQRHWQEAGCPRHLTRSGRAYWWPREVEAWMLAQRPARQAA